MVQKIGNLIRKHAHILFMILLFVLTVRVIVPQLDDLREILSSLDTANLYWVLFGIFVFFLTIPISALQYVLLALKPLSFGITCKVQTAALFVSKLLPQGIGSIGLNLYYLTKTGHTKSQAASVVTVDGVTSGIAYSIMLICALLISPVSFQGDNIDVSIDSILGLTIIVSGIVYLLLRAGWIRNKVSQAWRELKNNTEPYKKKPLNLLGSCAANGLSALTSIFVLWASAQAFGIELSVSGALLAYTFGNIAATLIPTPGGIGATEAGIYSGLVLIGIDGPNATLITLLYRLLTYWIPIIPGYIYFASIRKNLLSGFSLKKSYNT